MNKLDRARPVSDARSWAAQINAKWRQSLELVIEAGRILLEAKASLAHGEFTAMIDGELDFNPRTAQRLMAIAQDARLSNPTHAPLLPKAWTTLYELTTLTDEEFDRAVAEKIIHPKMERADVERIRPTRPDSEPLPNGARAIMGSRQEPDDSLDYFPTPPWATRALIERVFKAMKIDVARAKAWESACGEGHIAEVLEEYFAEVVTSDIHDYGYSGQLFDFLTGDAATFDHYDWIITNPPFGDKTEAFVLRALDLAKVGVAMFLRLQWLEGVGRYEEIFSVLPPTVVAFFAERVNLCKGRWEPEGSTATAYIWLVWIKGKAPRAPYWIPPGCRDALTRPDDAARFTQNPVAKRKAEAA